ncbi:hypothetical protein [Noviluteimonas gilva]|uniref:Uncharacterized protein n=1 Tax=Noviluteimonas gilva TaxID=2682097 RepID=A0A7C9HMA9_9GAMM|nr:hypothetical protein [Lysobacter gilvus]MUV14357.1 hypothetical protein [Lysobacter gilvus]
MPNPLIARDRWTTDDFASLSWHDTTIHAFKLVDQNPELGTSDLELDIDVLLEWRKRDDGTFDFVVAPATLRFHQVFGLRFSIDFVAVSGAVTGFQIEGIERARVPDAPASDESSHWRLPIIWPSGVLEFQSPGFTQWLTGAPVVSQSQSLPR